MDADKAKVWLKSVLYRTSLRARGQGVGFFLVEDRISLPERCPVLGMVLQYGSIAFDGATLARRDPTGRWTNANVWVISRSACGMLLNASIPLDLTKPFDFLPESERRRLYDQARERREVMRIVAECNKDFLAAEEAVIYPKWLSSEAPAQDPVVALRKILNDELV